METQKSEFLSSWLKRSCTSIAAKSNTPKPEISNNSKNTFYMFTGQQDTPPGMRMLLWSAAIVDFVLDS